MHLDKAKTAKIGSQSGGAGWLRWCACENRWRGGSGTSIQNVQSKVQKQNRFNGTITLGKNRRNVSGIGTESACDVSDGILVLLVIFELLHIFLALLASHQIQM